MLIVLCLLVIVSFTVLIGVTGWLEDLYYEKKNWLTKLCYYNSTEIDGVAVIIIVISGICLLIMLFILPFMHCGTDATVDRLQERYEAITYKVESGACRDELGLLSKEVIDEIQDWNETIVANKRLQNDYWLGIFVPNIYDQFETIDYDRYK